MLLQVLVDDALLFLLSVDSDSDPKFSHVYAKKACLCVGVVSGCTLNA